ASDPLLYVGAGAECVGRSAAAVVGGRRWTGGRDRAVAGGRRAGDRAGADAERVRLGAGGGILDPHGEPHHATHGRATGGLRDEHLDRVAAPRRGDGERLRAGRLPVRVADGHRHRAGGGDVGGRDAGGHARGADERRRASRAVPEHRGPGGEVGAVGGQREGGTAGRG